MLLNLFDVGTACPGDTTCPSDWIGSHRCNNLSGPPGRSATGRWSIHDGTCCLGRSKMRSSAVLPGILVTGLLAFATLTPSHGQAPSTLLIKGATIIDGLSDAPLRDRSLLIEGNTIRDLPAADAARRRGSGARSQRKIHHPGIVRFPCALARMDGRTLRQSRRDFRHGAGERTQGVARKEPGRSRPSAVLP